MAKRVVDVQPVTDEEEKLAEWYAEQARASPDTLEAAARSILGLITALLGVLFGVLAVASDPLPAYLRLPLVRGLGVVAVAALLVALIGALGTVLPRRIQVASARPDQQAAQFKRLLDRKSRWLTVAVVAFGVGLVALGASLMVALLAAA